MDEVGFWLASYIFDSWQVNSVNGNQKIYKEMLFVLGEIY